MHSAKCTFLAVSFCIACFTACHEPNLPATHPPVLSTEESVHPSAPPSTEEDTTIVPTSSTAEITNVTTTTSIEEPSNVFPSPSTEDSYSTAPPLSSTEFPTTAPPLSTTEFPTTAPPLSSTEFPTTAPPTTSSESISVTTPVETSPVPALNRGRAEEAFQLQNQVLDEHQVSTLQWSEPLYQIAAQRVQEITTDYSHSGCPDWVAENILTGTNRADLAVQVWYDSPGHQRNMLAGWTYGAIANYGFYWVAIYAMSELP